jgi:hypothetical protein
MDTMIDKLSAPQKRLLEDAYLVLRRDETLAHEGLCAEPGWFECRFTTRGAMEIFSRPQTAKSLCGLGLMEYRVTGSGYKDRGKWRFPKQYRITQEGINLVPSELRIR